MLTLVLKFEYYQVKIISVSEGIITDDDNAKLGIHVRGLINGKFHRNIQPLSYILSNLVGERSDLSIRKVQSKRMGLNLNNSLILLVLRPGKRLFFFFNLSQKLDSSYNFDSLKTFERQDMFCIPCYNIIGPCLQGTF